MGRKIKYLGTADNAVLEPGENFGGRLGTPLTHRAEWTLANGHLVDTDEVFLADAAIALLLKDGRFVEVTDMEVIPSSLGQQMWQGHPSAVALPKDATVVDGDGELKVDVLGGGLQSLVPPADGTPAADSPLVEGQTLEETTNETDESGPKGKSKKP